MNVEQPIAVVTGVSRGIGFEIARGLMAKGYRVLGTARDRNRAEDAMGELRSPQAQSTPPLTGRYEAYGLDVRDEKSIQTFVREVNSRHGRVDVLINNAGVALDKFVPTEGLKRSIVEETLAINVLGPLELVQGFLPRMKARNYGRIVNVSSQLGSLARMTGLTLAYRMSKAALNTMTRVLADELKDTNILVNSACPGWVRTELGGHDAPRSPAEGADTILWLATLEDDGPRGGFFQDRAPLPW